MNEAKYLMKNYGDRGGCDPSGRRPRRIEAVGGRG